MKLPALLLIDVQQGFDDLAYWGGARNNPDAEKRMAELLLVWRAAGAPVVHAQHCSRNANSRLHRSHPGWKIKPEVTPRAGEPVIEKDVNSCFIGTPLESVLREKGFQSLVIAGLTTDHCVSTTVRMAGNLGFGTYVVSDATATFDKRGPDGELFPAELIHRTALASLHEEFATVLTAERAKALLPLK
jgi:nicotinamidase-related amidase